MKLLSVGIDPDYVGIIADHASAELFDLQWPLNWLILYDSRNAGYFYNPTLKIKLVSVGIDHNHIGYPAD